MSHIVPMRFSVVKDLPGYLRVRFGAHAFTNEEGYGIADELQRILGVTSVKTATANGSVLVRYDANYTHCKEKILARLGEFDRTQLPQAKGSDEQLKQEIDEEFVSSLIKRVGAYALRRIFLPLPLRQVWTIYRSLGYVKKGIEHLLVPELSVEVLDATAISAAMLRGTFDSAGSIMLMLDISDCLEQYTHARSSIALEQSLAIQVDNAWLVTEDGDVNVPMDRIREGDIIRVRDGAMVPIDGTVVEGEAALNEASMTGESKLVIKSEGSSVFAGTVVEEGSIAIEVRKLGSDTRISRIVDLVDESEKLKAGVQSKAERLADAIVPFSFVAFFGILLATRNIDKAMAVLMVDYSCAIKLSTPVAVMSAMREAASRGMVVKGGRYLEVLADADTIVFDKTGTLTTASPAVKAVIPFGKMSEVEALRLSACLEEHFPHSMARAVVACAKERGVLHEEEDHAEVKYIVAHGIASAVDGKNVVLGSGHYVFEDEGVKPPKRLREKLEKMAPGCSTIFLAVDGKLEAAICINDPLRLESRETIVALRDAGFKKVVMLTGDAENAAKVAATELGIHDYRSQVLPEDKADIIEELKSEGHKVLMVGDGINDSPALAVADASIAMIDASDIAREVADVTLLNSSLDSILTLRKLSQKLMRRISRNYGIIVGFNTGLIVLGVAGILQPTTSALLHNASTTVITVANMTPLLDERE